jgi:riboflavin synthase alpha subunit
VIHLNFINAITSQLALLLGMELVVNASKVLEDAYIGCSIAVNGVCLTAVSFESNKVAVL